MKYVAIIEPTEQKLSDEVYHFMHAAKFLYDARAYIDDSTIAFDRAFVCKAAPDGSLKPVWTYSYGKWQRVEVPTVP